MHCWFHPPKHLQNHWPQRTQCDQWQLKCHTTCLHNLWLHWFIWMDRCCSRPLSPKISFLMACVEFFIMSNFVEAREVVAKWMKATKKVWPGWRRFVSQYPMCLECFEPLLGPFPHLFSDVWKSSKNLLRCLVFLGVSSHRRWIYGPPMISFMAGFVDSWWLGSPKPILPRMDMRHSEAKWQGRANNFSKPA